MKKGFTLIELLAVIVILAIIALIATPIILGIINDAKKESQERSAELYLSGVELAIARRNLTEEFNPTECKIQSEGNLICDEKDSLTVEVDGEVPTDGTIKFDENNKVTEGVLTFGTKFTATIAEGNVTIQDVSSEGTPGAKACTLSDTDEDRIADVGEVVTCNISETPDKFYVIEEADLSTATHVKMLTEMNIHTTNFRQSVSAGKVAFLVMTDHPSGLPNIQYPTDVYEGNLVDPIVNQYVSYLNTGLTVDATGNLLTYGQAESLGCDWSLGNCSSNNINGGPVSNPAPTWLYSTTYWLSTVQEINSVFFICVDGWFDWTNGTATEKTCTDGIDYDLGVRPVITISTNDIQ